MFYIVIDSDMHTFAHNILFAYAEYTNHLVPACCGESSKYI